jgi:glyoxylase-like metal-dependent hydrolase (beta-lactamase superfamily II)
VSEPRTVAREILEVVPGVWHWRIHDERIDFLSAAHAVRADGGSVLVDPLPVDSGQLAKVGDVTAIVLTCGSHGRSAWRLRDELGVPVHVPSLSETLRDRADGTYGDGDELPGGLRAVFTPGAGTTQHTLVLRDPAVAFVPDLLAQAEGEELSLIPAEYMADAAEARRSVEKLLDLDIEILCLGHGVPVTENAKSALRRALEG